MPYSTICTSQKDTNHTKRADNCLSALSLSPTALDVLCCPMRNKISEISGFRLGVVELVVLLGCQTAWVARYTQERPLDS